MPDERINGKDSAVTDSEVWGSNVLALMNAARLLSQHELAMPTE